MEIDKEEGPPSTIRGAPGDRTRVMGDRESMGQLVTRMFSEMDVLRQDMYKLAALVDSAFVGADYNAHRSDHIEIIERRIERRRFWSNLRAQSIAGALMAVGGALAGWLVYLVSVLMGA